MFSTAGINAYRDILHEAIAISLKNKGLSQEEIHQKIREELINICKLILEKVNIGDYLGRIILNILEELEALPEIASLLEKECLAIGLCIKAIDILEKKAPPKILYELSPVLKKHIETYCHSKGLIRKALNILRKRGNPQALKELKPVLIHFLYDPDTGSDLLSIVIGILREINEIETLRKAKPLLISILKNKISSHSVLAKEVLLALAEIKDEEDLSLIGLEAKSYPSIIKAIKDLRDTVFLDGKLTIKEFTFILKGIILSSQNYDLKREAILVLESFCEKINISSDIELPKTSEQIPWFTYGEVIERFNAQGAPRFLSRSLIVEIGDGKVLVVKLLRKGDLPESLHT